MIADLAHLVQEAAARGSRRVAIVLPSGHESLLAAALVRQRGIGQCTLVGDAAAARALAAEQGLDLSSMALVDQADPQRAIAQALELARGDQADVLVVDGAPWHLLPQGIDAGSPLSGVSVLEIQEPRRLLLVTDGLLLVSPSTEERIGIVENAIAVAHRLGIDTPRVALVAAAETVNPKSAFTIDAAQITVMAKRKQIAGALVDGPLGFDNAVSAQAAETKGVASEIGGRADVLVVPDLEAGALLIQTLSVLCHLPAVHAIVGGRVPVVLWPAESDADARLRAVALGSYLS